MKRDVRLYNAIFPIWMIQILSPIGWLFTVVGNFAIDSMVILAVAALCKAAEKGKLYRASIWKVFLLGFAADIIGGLCMLLISLIFQIAPSGDELYLTIPGLVFTAGLIFIFNYFISFRKQEKSFRFKQAIALAVLTAPYTFLIPTDIFRNNGY